MSDESINKYNKQKLGKKIESILTTLIFLTVIFLLWFIVYLSFKSPEFKLGIGADIEEVRIDEDSKNAYIRLKGGSNANEITKIKFVFTDTEGMEYVYETEKGSSEISVPFKRSFWQWLLRKQAFVGAYDYRISSGELGLKNFQHITDISVILEYEEEQIGVETPVLDTEEPVQETPKIPISGGGWGGDGGGGGESPPLEPEPSRSIEFILPTPIDGSVLAEQSVEIKVNITQENLDEFKFNWNGEYYVFYGKSLVLMMNLDNISSLGENYSNSNGTTILDLSKYENHGIIYFGDDYSGEYSDGRYGGAYIFDGLDDYINMSDDDNLDLGTSDFTFTSWIKLRGDNSGTIISKGLAWNYNSEGYEFRTAGTLLGNSIVFAINNGAGDDYSRKFVAIERPDSDTWVHIAVVGDRYGNMTMYKDGEIVITAENPKDISEWSSDDISNSHSLEFGRRQFQDYFNGAIDEPRIWNRALSADEVKQVYYSSLGKYDIDKWHFYTTPSNLSEGTYTYSASIKDSSGNEKSTETRTFNINLTIPGFIATGINFTSPTPSDGYSQSHTSIYVNVSASDTASNISTFIDFNNSLVGWWRMDDTNSSGDVVDYTGRNNGIIKGNPVQVDGMLGKGIEFDGTDDYIEVPDSSLWYHGSNDYTYSMWVKFSSTNPDIMVLKDQGYDTTVTRAHLIYYIHSSEELHVATSTDGSANSDQAFNWKADVGRWYHLVVRRSGADLMAFVDDNQIGGALVAGDVYDTSGPLRIGSELAGYFSGTIDDVIIFNRALTKAEIQALYVNSTFRNLDNNFTGLAQGEYMFRAYMQDLEGKISSTETRTVTIDLSLPVLKPSIGVIDFLKDLFKLLFS